MSAREHDGIVRPTGNLLAWAVVGFVLWVAAGIWLFVNFGAMGLAGGAAMWSGGQQVDHFLHFGGER